MNLSKGPLSDTVTFTYTDESAMKKLAIKPQDIQNMADDDLTSALQHLANRIGQMKLQPKENANQPGKLVQLLLLVLAIKPASKLSWQPGGST